MKVEIKQGNAREYRRGKAWHKFMYKVPYNRKWYYFKFRQSAINFHNKINKTK